MDEYESPEYIPTRATVTMKVPMSRRNERGLLLLSTETNKRLLLLLSSLWEDDYGAWRKEEGDVGRQKVGGREGSGKKY